MAKWKIVLTDSEFETNDPERRILSKLEDVDLQILGTKDPDEIAGKVSDCDAIIMQYANVNRKVIEAAKNCKIISKYAIGLDLIDIPAATERGICVGHVRDYCIDEVSTHTVVMLLDLNRKITFLSNRIKSGSWGYKQAKKIFNLRGQTLGLYSFGKIAALVAEKMRPYGMNIIAFDPFFNQEVADRLGVQQVTFEELAEKSDILINHAADMPATRGTLNESFFSKMKPTSYVINTGRGPVVNETDLIAALQNKVIAGAALDVTDPEPSLPENPLLKMDNVLITPHSAYYSEESLIKLQELTTENVVQRLNGYYPRYLGNPEIKETLKLKELDN